MKYEKTKNGAVKLFYNSRAAADEHVEVSQDDIETPVEQAKPTYFSDKAYFKDKAPDSGVMEAVIPAIVAGTLSAVVVAGVFSLVRWLEYKWNDSDVDTLSRWMADLHFELGALLLFGGLGFSYAVGLDYYAWLKNKKKRAVLPEYHADTIAAMKRLIGACVVCGAIAVFTVMFIPGLSMFSETSAGVFGVGVGAVITVWKHWRGGVAALDGLCAWVNFVPGAPPGYLDGWRGVLIRKESPANPMRQEVLSWVVFFCVFCVAQGMFKVQTPFAAAVNSMLLGVLVFGCFVIAIATPAAIALGNVRDETESDDFQDAAEHFLDKGDGEELFLAERDDRRS